MSPAPCNSVSRERNQDVPALSLFLSKKGIKTDVRVGATNVLISPLFYKERMKEAKNLSHELRKPN